MSKLDQIEATVCYVVDIWEHIPADAIGDKGMSVDLKLALNALTHRWHEYCEINQAEGHKHV